MFYIRKLNFQIIYAVITISVCFTFLNTSVWAQTTENYSDTVSVAPTVESKATSGNSGQSLSTVVPTIENSSPGNSATQPPFTTEIPLLSTKSLRSQTSEPPMLGDEPSVTIIEPVFDLPAYSLQLINNSDFLYLEFIPKPNMLEIVIKMNKTLYKDFQILKSTETSRKFVPLKIDIGFYYEPLIDVISIPLVPFTEVEDLEKVGESSSGNTKDGVQDLSWSKHGGVLIPDVVQSYQLLSLDVADNGTFIATRITRPWLSCDENDVQFTLEPIAIYWNLVSSEEHQTVLTSEMPKSANQQAGGATTDASSQSSDPLLATTSSSNPTVTYSDQAVAMNASTEGSVFSSTGPPSSGESTNQTSSYSTTAEPEVEVLRSIEDLNFRGPIYLNPIKIFGNRTSILLQGCSAFDGNQGKRKLYPLYNCTMKEYEERRQIKSLLRVYGLMMLPQAQASERQLGSGNGGKSFFAEHEFQPCPSSKEFEDISNSLFRALTGGGGGKRRGKMNGMESESRNHGMSSYDRLTHSLYLVIQLTFTLISLLSSSLTTNPLIC